MNKISKTPDEVYMELCLRLAQMAAAQDEVPVGALITRENKIIAVGYNNRESKKSACSHAEIHAIENACRNLGRWRLTDCTLYVNLEPCLMCAGAIQQARLSRVVFGCHDAKGGAYGSLYNIHTDARLNHIPESVTSDILGTESAQLLKDFFSARRTKNK